jgi:hypothetical protein
MSGTPYTVHKWDRAFKNSPTISTAKKTQEKSVTVDDLGCKFNEYVKKTDGL